MQPRPRLLQLKPWGPTLPPDAGEIPQPRPRPPAPGPSLAPGPAPALLPGTRWWWELLPRRARWGRTPSSSCGTGAAGVNSVRKPGVRGHGSVRPRPLAAPRSPGPNGGAGSGRARVPGLSEQWREVRALPDARCPGSARSGGEGAAGGRGSPVRALVAGGAPALRAQGFGRPRGAAGRGRGLPGLRTWPPGPRGLSSWRGVGRLGRVWLWASAPDCPFFAAGAAGLSVQTFESLGKAAVKTRGLLLPNMSFCLFVWVIVVGTQRSGRCPTWVVMSV